MLKQHLLQPIYPPTKAENVVHFLDYRISVLFDRLIRIEKSKDGEFLDLPTQSVVRRDMKKVPFTVKRGKDVLTLSTKAVKLTIRPNLKDCRVDIGKGDMPLSNEGNLLGAMRTLDGFDGDRHWETHKKAKLENGVCSKSGVAVWEDTSLSFDETGHLTTKKHGGKDLYLFAYGNDYVGAVKGLYAICGQMPLIPRYAFGNWWSRYHVYTDHEYLAILNRFKEKDVPLTVATIDMDWHYSDENEMKKKFAIPEEWMTDVSYTGDLNVFGGLGWTGYTFHEDLFPDYKGFLKGLKEDGYHITINLHPAQGIRYWEDQYPAFAEYMGVDKESKKAIPFDLTDDKFINGYFDILHHPFEEAGVDFWWIDWQQGTQSKVAGLDPLWLLNHYHYLDNHHTQKQGLILSRYAGVGSHRYPFGFSGDTSASWKTIDYLPYFTATASNVGYAYWSHDIGGHHLGIKDDELYLRAIQFGVFSPINRMHCCVWETFTKEPSYYKTTGLIIEDFLRFRHQMIPMLYSASNRLHEEGIPLMQPLYHVYQEEGCYDHPNEYIFCEQLLVQPITKPVGKNGLQKVSMYLPKGKWTDIFTGEQYDINEDTTKDLYRGIESFPALAKAGSVLPLSADKGNGTDNPTRLDLWLYSGNGAYSLYEDKNEKSAVTTFTMAKTEENGKEVQTLTISHKGAKSVIPKKRVLKIVLKDVKQRGKVQVFEDGVEIPATVYASDHPALLLPYRPSHNYTVVFTYEKESRLEYIKKIALEFLTVEEAENFPKLKLYLKMKEAKTIEELLTVLSTWKKNSYTIIKLQELL